MDLTPRLSTTLVTLLTLATLVCLVSVSLRRARGRHGLNATVSPVPIYKVPRRYTTTLIPRSIDWYLDPKNRYYDAVPIDPYQLLDTSDLAFDTYVLGPGIDTLRSLPKYHDLALLLEKNAFRPDRLDRS